MEHETGETNLSVQSNDIVEEQESGAVVCNPHKRYFRYLGLVFVCFLSLGSIFSNNLTPLQDHFIKDLSISMATDGLLTSLLTWPNVVFCFFGGYLNDRVFGKRLGAIIFSAIVFVGQFLVAIGAFAKWVWLVGLGLLIFGIGSGLLPVAQNTYAAAWFPGRELNLVFGLLFSYNLFGQLATYQLIPMIYNVIDKNETGSSCLGYTLIIASLTCLASFLCAVLLGLLDKRRSRLIPSEHAKASSEIKFSDALRFPLTLWLITLVCLAYTCALTPLLSLGQGFFIRKFNFAPNDANNAYSVFFLISGCTTPIFGFIIGSFGFNTIWLIAATVGANITYILLMFTNINPFVTMSVLSLSYALFGASILPMVPMVVPNNQLGTAYGLLISVQSLGTSLIGILAGHIIDNEGYFILNLISSGLICVALFCSISLYLVDKIQGGILGISQKKREQVLEARRK